MGQPLRLLTPLWAAVCKLDHVGVGKLWERHTRWELSLTGGPAGDGTSMRLSLDSSWVGDKVMRKASVESTSLSDTRGYQYLMNQN